MDRHTWQRVTDLFQRALPLSTEERAALLAAECADAPQVRAEVEAMLAASDEDAHTARIHDFADHAAAGDTETVAPVSRGVAVAEIIDAVYERSGVDREGER